MKILMVCSGNTCRSSLAAAMLQERILRAAELSGITVSSAGTSAVPGSPASEGSYLVAIELGLDLSAHRARAVDAKLLAEADLVLTMSERHTEALAMRGLISRAQTLAAFAGHPDGIDEVGDPFGGSIEDYRATAATLSILIEGAVERLRAERA